MNHQRTSVSALVTLLVAVVATGSLFAPARFQHTSRRHGAPARVSRTAQRLDTADAISHDSDHQDPAITDATHALTVHPPGVRAAAVGGRGTFHSWKPVSPATLTATILVDLRPIITSHALTAGAPDLPTHLIPPSAGRAPPSPLFPAV